VTDEEQARSGTDLVIVTGVSGGGRSTVARALENVGYYVVDNLPQALMLDMAELAHRAGGTARRTAMVLDVRSRAFSTDLAGAIKALKDQGFSPRVVFVDADTDVLIRRFESVRRPHPLQGDGRLSDGIVAERELLPPDADFVLDARFLPNPYWVPELREHTGQEPDVSRYVLDQPGASAFVDTYASLIGATAPGFEREGKRYLTVAVGCTGGKHRSVAIAEELSRRLHALRLVATAQHRDLGRE